MIHLTFPHWQSVERTHTHEHTNLAYRRLADKSVIVPPPSAAESFEKKDVFPGNQTRGSLKRAHLSADLCHGDGELAP